MKRNDAEQIGKLIQQYLRQESLESPSERAAVAGCLAAGVGGRRQAIPVIFYIRNQTLYVHLTSAALRQELMMGRELLVRTLNQRVGATVITNIIFVEERNPVCHFHSQFPECFVCPVIIERSFQILVAMSIHSDNGSTAFVCRYFPESRVGEWLSAHVYHCNLRSRYYIPEADSGGQLSGRYAC